LQARVVSSNGEQEDRREEQQREALGTPTGRRWGRGVGEGAHAPVPVLVEKEWKRRSTERRTAKK
jgi:hypothetical protein